MKAKFQHQGPHLGIVATIFMFLFIAGLSFVISLSGTAPFFPGPFESAEVIVKYFREQQQDVLWCAFFQFGAAIPLGIFTATVVSRLSFLGSKAAGNNIALFGGFFTAFNLALSAMIMWVMSYPQIAADENIIRTLYYLVFTIGGVGYSVPIALLFAGIAVQSFFMKSLPKWLCISGIVLAVFGVCSTLFLIFPGLLFLIPLTRFPGFIWLIIVGFKLPRTN